MHYKEAVERNRKLETISTSFTLKDKLILKEDNKDTRKI